MIGEREDLKELVGYYHYLEKLLVMVGCNCVPTFLYLTCIHHCNPDLLVPNDLSINVAHSSQLMLPILLLSVN